ncbi:nitroreductase [Acinetobacter sp. 194]|uniref:nitroreductase n=1 Tax=Acinetobacter shaoyimingii TaxID=2715164 RepID=UPI00140A1A3F|nr:nitroreductase [Acinetobacter shaoyimingii]NHB57636.1 nitroreductase [Acinetobacter shaoyimingii]
MSLDQVQCIDQIIQSRQSIRAYLKTPIDRQIIEDILNVAARAPSGTNTQPWKVYVVTGRKRSELIDRVCQTQTEIFKNPELAQQYQETFVYYPEKWVSPFIERRRENGWGLYGLIGIEKGDKDKMAAQHLRNYQLFDAPVGLFITVDKVMGIGSKMDISMFMQNIMLAAKARGLDTCPQAAWNHFHRIVLEVLDASDQEELVCAIALGYADPNAIVNQFVTPREPAENFAVFLD